MTHQGFLFQVQCYLQSLFREGFEILNELNAYLEFLAPWLATALPGKL